MNLACLDLEGVLVPEIWIAVAETTGILELRRTTRDEPDYDRLMRWRLAILEQHGIDLPQIQKVIGTLDPLPGALDFLNWLRERASVIILSDTFSQFAAPLMAKLGYPALFCHSLVVDEQGKIVDYRLRLQDQKRRSVEAFRQLAFHVVAAGDSWNDLSMLQAASRGVLFCPPQTLTDRHPELPVAKDYEGLRKAFLNAFI